MAARRGVGGLKSQIDVSVSISITYICILFAVDGLDERPLSYLKLTASAHEVSRQPIFYARRILRQMQGQEGNSGCC